MRQPHWGQFNKKKPFPRREKAKIKILINLSLQVPFSISLD
jgi:hypothetical protein